jgi:hypothetical protein
MSALGQKRTHALQQKESSSDQPVGAGEQRRRSSLPMHVPKHDWLHGFGCQICGRKLHSASGAGKCTTPASCVILICPALNNQLESRASQRAGCLAGAPDMKRTGCHSKIRCFIPCRSFQRLIRNFVSEQVFFVRCGNKRHHCYHLL